MKSYKILALEPFYGGSHKRFIDDWIDNSCHNWTLLTLSDNSWMWRMRHSAISFVSQIKKLADAGETWDIIFCSDMLNLAELIGMLPKEIGKLPTVVYFHENQLAYPLKNEDKRNKDLILSNFTTALAADFVWFNSQFNLDSFLFNLPKFLKQMPEPNTFSDEIKIIRQKSSIHPLGIIHPNKVTTKRKDGPIRIVWAARWEFDKNPKTFFDAIRILKSKNINFRLNVLGEQPKTYPDIFDKAYLEFKEHIDHWGFAETSQEYYNILRDNDLFVSTAIHEFFGISALEACARGVFPLLPNRLAYPEIFSDENNNIYNEYFYDGSTKSLANKIEHLSNKILSGSSIWDNIKVKASQISERYEMNKIIADLDKNINFSFRH